MSVPRADIQSNAADPKRAAVLQDTLETPGKPPSAISLTKARIRRTSYAFFRFEDEPVIRVNLLLGKAEATSRRVVLASAILTGKEWSIEPEDLLLLQELPSDKWIPAAEALTKLQGGPNRIREFLQKGLILSDDPSKFSRELRRRDQLLSSTAWNIHAALYHFLTKWCDRGVRKRSSADGEAPNAEEVATQEALRQLVADHGKAPGHFYRMPGTLKSFEVPMITRDDGLYKLLERRKTTRGFDEQPAMLSKELGIILYYVFGCHGYMPVSEGLTVLKKTSPSGGSLHPVEVYPLLINVTGLDPGLYHYTPENHLLAQIAVLSRERAAELANEFMAGQSYASRAQALFIMAARFYRSFWKYRYHPKAYGVLLMDAAHLSQTFYLVCADLGLGAFVSAAVNAVNIEQRLGLDGFAQGAIAMCGCGRVAEGRSALDARFLPHVLRRTRPANQNGV